MRHYKENYLVLLLFVFMALSLSLSVRDIILVKALGVGVILGFCVAAYLITRRRRDQLILIPLGLFALAVNVAMQTSTEPHFIMMLLARLLWIGFAAYLSIMVFRQIFAGNAFHSQEIYGAIAIYLLFGFIFAQFYHILLAVSPAAIAFDPTIFGPEGLQDGDILYFSFVTLATVGYGDIIPATPAARAISVIEAVVGIMYVATFIARFVSIGRTPPAAGHPE